MLLVCMCLSFSGLLSSNSLLAQEKTGAAEAQEKHTDRDQQNVVVKLLPLRTSFMVTTFGRDREKMTKTSVYRTASAHLLFAPEQLRGTVAVRNRHTSWFYLFHNCVIDRPESKYLVQRIDKRISNYVAPGAEPAVTQHYAVEAFKCSFGQSKAPDQHYASYSLGKYKRRVIEKKLEVGPVAGKDGEVAQWPFPPSRLYESIQSYGPAKEKYDEVNFTRSVTWNIRVEMDDTGRYHLQVPELGIDVLRQVPKERNAASFLDWNASRTLLSAGQGIQLGATKLSIGINNQDTRALLGPPLRIIGTEPSHYFDYGNGLKLYFGKQESLSLIQATSPFSGSTNKGVKLGDTLEKVKTAYGDPDRVVDATHFYDGIFFTISKGVVSRITVKASEE